MSSIGNLLAIPREWVSDAVKSSYYNGFNDIASADEAAIIDGVRARKENLQCDLIKEGAFEYFLIHTAEKVNNAVVICLNAPFADALKNPKRDRYWEPFISDGTAVVFFDI